MDKVLESAAYGLTRACLINRHKRETKGELHQHAYTPCLSYLAGGLLGVVASVLPGPPHSRSVRSLTPPPLGPAPALAAPACKPALTPAAQGAALASAAAAAADDVEDPASAVARASAPPCLLNAELGGTDAGLWGRAEAEGGGGPPPMSCRLGIPGVVMTVARGVHVVAFAAVVAGIGVGVAAGVVGMR
eukprot:scaffold198824_cov22-Tisochrysis_lutea.AAC.1